MVRAKATARATPSIKSYTLDAAGNRLTSTENREGQLYAQTNYAYNSLDWLTSTSTQTQNATNNVSYNYDANSAQVSQTTVFKKNPHQPRATTLQTWLLFSKLVLNCSFSVYTPNMSFENLNSAR